MASQASLKTCPDLSQSQHRQVLSHFSPPRNRSLIIPGTFSPDAKSLSTLPDGFEDEERVLPECYCPKMTHTRECCVIALKCLFKIESVDWDSAEQQILVVNGKDRVAFSVVKTSDILLACVADEDKRYLAHSKTPKNDQVIKQDHFEMKEQNKPTISTFASGNALHPMDKPDSLPKVQTLVNEIPVSRQTSMVSSITEIPINYMTESIPEDYLQDLAQTTKLLDELLASNITINHSLLLEKDPIISPKKETSEQIHKLCSLQNQAEIEEHKGQSIIATLPAQAQPASKPISRRESEDIQAIISKDISRSFQSLAYFKHPSIQFLLKELLIRISEEFPDIGYIQGINYIACGVVYHCQHYVKAWKVIDFLFRRLQMNNIYHFESFEVHIILLKRLFKVTNHRLFERLEQLIDLDLKILVLEWFYCLGFNRVPLEYSHLLMEKLITHGWFFFYRLLYNCIDLALQSVSAILYSQSLNDHHKFEIEYQLKNFHKARVDWIEVLTECLTIELDDQLIAAHLRWTHSDFFTMIN
jgi:hypothetical protein